MKLCKTCGCEAFKWRTKCLKCINKETIERAKKKKTEEKIKVRKEKVKVKKQNSITSLKNKLWKIVSEYIRRRDSDNEMATCVTCWDRKHWKQQQAGHYIPAGSSNYLRYVETNIHVQCYGCNVWKHSNPIEYRIFMENKYWKDYVELLIQQRNEIIKFTPEYLNQLIEDYKEKLYLLGIEK